MWPMEMLEAEKVETLNPKAVMQFTLLHFTLLQFTLLQIQTNAVQTYAIHHFASICIAAVSEQMPSQ